MQGELKLVDWTLNDLVAYRNYIDCLVEQKIRDLDRSFDNPNLSDTGSDKPESSQEDEAPRKDKKPKKEVKPKREVKGKKMPNGKYQYDYHCEVCNCNTANMSCHVKTIKHKRNVILTNPCFNSKEKYDRIGALSIKLK